MRTVCHSCDAVYEIPDAKVAAGDLLVRCASCRAIMVVNRRYGNLAEAIPSTPNLALLANEPSDDGSSISAAQVPSLEEPTRPDLPTLRRKRVSSAPAPSVSGWFASVDGERKGPFTDEEMVSLAADGAIGPTSFVWKKGLPRWRQLQETNELRHLNGERELRAAEVARRVTDQAIGRAIDLNAAQLRSEPPAPAVASPIPSPVPVEPIASLEYLVDVKVSRARLAAAFAAGFLGVSLLWVLGLYTLPALFF